ncbi:MAG: hypothetical protein ABSE51_22680, partial [Terracidiphilus sp.]
AHQNRALTKQWDAVAIFADDEVDDHFAGKDRLGRDALGCGYRITINSLFPSEKVSLKLKAEKEPTSYL